MNSKETDVILPAKLDLDYLTEVGVSENPNKRDGIAAKVDENSTAREAQEPQTAFNRLVLPEGHKNMVLSLIAQHFRDKASSRGQSEQGDIVRGKGIIPLLNISIHHENHMLTKGQGRGLILLLHGAPGVGKTSTAGELLLALVWHPSH